MFTRATRRIRDDQGQSTLEWLGVGAVVVAISIALVVAAPGMGTAIQERFTCLVSALTGGGGCNETAGNPGEPQRACTTSVTQGSVSAGVRVAVVDLEGGQGVIIRETSDGKVHVTFVEDGSIGVSGRVGGGASANVGGTGIGGEAEAELGGALGLENGDTRVFDNREDAEAYIADRAIDEGIDLLPPGVEQVADLGKDLIGGIFGHDPPQGEAENTHSQVDISAEGSASAVAGVLGGEVSLAIEAGARVTTKPDGSRTVRLRASGEVAAELGIPVAASGNGSASSEVHLELDIDADGNPTAARVRLTTEGGLGAEFSPTNVRDVADGLQKAGAAIGGSDTERTVITAELDLTDPSVGDAFGDLIGATTDAATGDGSVREIGDAGQTVLDELAEHGTLSIEEYDVGNIDAGVSASGNLGIGLGAELGLEGSEATLVDASYFDPTTGRLVPWEGCLAGAN